MSTGTKRPGEGVQGALVSFKRPKQDLVPVRSNETARQLVQSGPPRTSSLESPIMQLFGHQGGIMSCKFSPSGATIASAAHDRLIYLWNVYGECENYVVMKGHTGAIMELQYSTDSSMVFTCAVDKTGAVWDCEVAQRVKKLKGHTSFVNSICPSRRGLSLLVSGSDDGNIKVWDIRKKGAVHTLNNTYQITSVCFSDAGDQIMSGGLENSIKVWDLRQTQLMYSLAGHMDTVTGLRVSPNGNYLLSNSMDDTVRIWDIRPFAPNDRQLKIFRGNRHSFEKNLLRCCWSPDGSRIAAGSSDRFVYVWDSVTQRILYRLPGHLGSVNDVDFHPNEPIILSGSSDKTMYLGELQ